MVASTLFFEVKEMEKLVHSYRELYTEAILTTFRADNFLEEKKFDREIRKLDFKNKFEASERDKKRLIQKNHKLILSVGIARSQVEHIEEDINSDYEFPSKPEMINELKNDGKWQHEEKHVSYHYVQFYYYITKSGKQLADFILNLLGDDVSLHDFCCVVGKLYSITNFRFHEPVETLTVKEIKIGLQKFGSLPKLLECVDIINNIFYNRPLKM